MAWIVYCDGGVEEYATEQEALDAAADFISDMCADGQWEEEVNNILVAEITHRTVMANEVTKEMLDEEGCHNGRHYSGGYDYYCDYVMSPEETELTRLRAALLASEAKLARVQTIAEEAIGNTNNSPNFATAAETRRIALARIITTCDSVAEACERVESQGNLARLEKACEAFRDALDDALGDDMPATRKAMNALYADTIGAALDYTKGGEGE